MQQALPKVQVYAQVHMLWYMPRENRSADSKQAETDHSRVEASSTLPVAKLCVLVGGSLWILHVTECSLSQRRKHFQISVACKFAIPRLSAPNNPSVCLT